ncbi:protein kintoun-like [Scomber japonicus]|uniref:protein kintoun-like n=1 Tax=Scomber japonicus TaxID=13676 RepID=UPI002304E5A1|nr:protein kintoun-like [Scomber japonicus]
MEVGESLKELNMTADEISRFTKAFKDEKFREMLHDYAQEISDPANKKKYEEEITLLEQERGNNIEFIHPEPFRALRTSVNGKQKCYINICSNEKVGKPECKWGVSDDGHRGQCWSLPHSLHPGRQDTDPKGNKIMIYDVIFHPDTIHIARRNTRFMDMLDNTAIQGIQDAFKVTLDKSNVREMSTKYKGTPQACVIRKPVPGYKARVPSEQPDPLAFPYPDEKKRPTTSPKTKNSKHIQPQKAKGPTTPSYTVKYRSFIDLQDFRCSRDSAKSPRPKAIVVTVDLPLLKSVRDANLEVKEKSLLLESKKPAYRLELPLAYPVDEDKGEAKFNRQRGQLTITLPVLPSSEVFDFTVGTAQAVSEEEEEKEEDKLKEEEREGNKCEEEVGNVEERGLEQQKEEKEEDQLKEEEEEEEREGNKCEKEEVGNVEERGLEQQKREVEKSEEEENKSEVEEEKQQNREAEKSDEIHESRVEEEEEEILKEQKGDSEEAVKSNQQDEQDEERELHNTLKEEDKTREIVDGNLKVETMTTPPNYTPSEESHTAAVVVSERAESSEAPAVDKANKSRLGGNRVVHFSEEPSQSSDNGSEEVDEDDLPTEHNIQNPEPDKKLPPPVLLREIDQDGNETIISDHSTSAGFTFQNSLLYELD